MTGTRIKEGTLTFISVHVLRYAAIYILCSTMLRLNTYTVCIRQAVNNKYSAFSVGLLELKIHRWTVIFHKHYLKYIEFDCKGYFRRFYTLYSWSSKHSRFFFFFFDKTFEIFKHTIHWVIISTLQNWLFYIW